MICVIWCITYRLMMCVWFALADDVLYILKSKQSSTSSRHAVWHVITASRDLETSSWHMCVRCRDSLLSFSLSLRCENTHTVAHNSIHSTPDSFNCCSVSLYICFFFFRQTGQRGWQVGAGVGGGVWLAKVCSMNKYTTHIWMTSERVVSGLNIEPRQYIELIRFGTRWYNHIMDTYLSIIVIYKEN